MVAAADSVREATRPDAARAGGGKSPWGVCGVAPTSEYDSRKRSLHDEKTKPTRKGPEWVDHALLTFSVYVYVCSASEEADPGPETLSEVCGVLSTNYQWRWRGSSIAAGLCVDVGVG